MVSDPTVTAFATEDPDGNLVEVAEALESVVRRLASQGWEEEALAAKTYLSPEEIRRILDDDGSA